MILQSFFFKFLTIGCLLLNEVSSLQVYDLNTKNFDQVVDGFTNVLVLFYSYDCVHCVTAKPEYEAVASLLKESDDIILGRVDMDEDDEIAKRFSIKGAPTYKLFRKGDTVAENFYVVHYNGRLGNTLIQLLNKKLSSADTSDTSDTLKSNGNFKTLDYKLPNFKNHAKKLNGDTFYEYIKNSYALIYIYMPWSDQDGIRIMLQQVGDAFEDSGVKLGKLTLETKKERTVCEDLEVTEWPTIVLSAPNGKIIKYAGDMSDAYAVTKFINAKAGTHVSLIDEDQTSVFKRVVNLMKPVLVRYRSMRDLMEKREDATQEGVDELEDNQVEENQVEDVSSILAMAQDIYKNDLTKPEQAVAKHYLKVLERVSSKGIGYIREEIKRLEKISKGASVTPTSAELFKLRLNILQEFLITDQAPESLGFRDEL